MTTDTAHTAHPAGTPIGPAALPALKTVTKRRRLAWLWLAIGVGLALLLIASLVVQGLAAVPALDVTIDGERVVSGWSMGHELAGLGPFQQVAVASVALIALLAMVVVLPVTLAIAAITIGFVVLLAVGIPLLVGLAILGVFVAPLVLIGWLIWKAAT